MAKCQYSADSAHDPDVFPRPLMLPGALRRNASPPVADGDPAAWHSFAPVGIHLPAEASFISITLHS